MNQQKQTEEVGVFEGYVDGEPLVKWLDRSRMPQPGDKLYFGAVQAPAPIPEQVAQATGLESLTRYDYVPGESGRMAIGVEDGGAFLSYYDVERLLATQSAKQGADSSLALISAELIAEPWDGCLAFLDGEEVDVGKKMREQLTVSKQSEPSSWDEFIKSCGYVETGPGKFSKPALAQASVEQATGAKELAEQLRRYHFEVWDWDILLKAADMIERIDRASTAGAESGGKGGKDA